MRHQILETDLAAGLVPVEGVPGAAVVSGPRGDVGPRWRIDWEGGVAGMRRFRIGDVVRDAFVPPAWGRDADGLTPVRHGVDKVGAVIVEGGVPI